jgi:hypothetical protein
MQTIPLISTHLGHDHLSPISDLLSTDIFTPLKMCLFIYSLF